MVIAAHAINVPMAPRVSELWETHEHDKLRQTVWKATKVSTILVFGTCAVIILIGQWVLSIFGEEFAVMYSALWLLAGAQLFNAACGSSGVLLNMTGHQRSSALCVAAGVLVNLILGIVLIPTWGAWGAAAALAASIITWNTGMLVAVRKHLGFDPSILTAIKKKNIL